MHYGQKVTLMRRDSGMVFKLHDVQLIYSPSVFLSLGSAVNYFIVWLHFISFLK